MAKVFIKYTPYRFVLQNKEGGSVLILTSSSNSKRPTIFSGLQYSFSFLVFY
ncbi:hypothetical protein BROOK1789C_1887 [Bathymodiolus brooksi thiotrophic gill symbiont]|nr:hypothetical protein BROOK1789C_1887 [Bathymodiolus brooksi thiotrophic gill symbiont]